MSKYGWFNQGGLNRIELKSKLEVCDAPEIKEGAYRIVSRGGKQKEWLPALIGVSADRELTKINFPLMYGCHGQILCPLHFRITLRRRPIEKGSGDGKNLLITFSHDPSRLKQIR